MVNHECKQVVAGYGQQMLELLKAQVLAHSLFKAFKLLASSTLLTLLDKWIHSSGRVNHLSNSTSGHLQTPPAQVCSKIGLCTFDGEHGVRFLNSLATYFGFIFEVLVCNN